MHLIKVCVSGGKYNFILAGVGCGDAIVDWCITRSEHMTGGERPWGPRGHRQRASALRVTGLGAANRLLLPFPPGSSVRPSCSQNHRTVGVGSDHLVQPPCQGRFT